MKYVDDNYITYIKDENSDTWSVFGFAHATPEKHQEVVIILDSIFGCDVTLINDSAFKKNEYIKEVYFGSNIKVVGDGAFYACDNLKKVSLNEGVVSFKDGCFLDCTGLDYIKFPSTVKHIHNLSFFNIGDLQKIYIPCGIETLSITAFPSECIVFVGKNDSLSNKQLYPKSFIFDAFGTYDNISFTDEFLGSDVL